MPDFTNIAKTGFAIGHRMLVPKQILGIGGRDESNVPEINYSIEKEWFPCAKTLEDDSGQKTHVYEIYISDSATTTIEEEQMLLQSFVVWNGKCYEIESWRFQNAEPKYWLIVVKATGELWVEEEVI
jgi:hypothetical protein